LLHQQHLHFAARALYGIRIMIRAFKAIAK